MLPTVCRPHHPSPDTMPTNSSSAKPQQPTNGHRQLQRVEVSSLPPFHPSLTAGKLLTAMWQPNDEQQPKIVVRHHSLAWTSHAQQWPQRHNIQQWPHKQPSTHKWHPAPTNNTQAPQTIPSPHRRHPAPMNRSLPTQSTTHWMQATLTWIKLLWKIF